MTSRFKLLTCTILHITPLMNDKSSRLDQSSESVNNSIILRSQNINRQNQTDPRETQSSTPVTSSSTCIKKKTPRG
jgi:hypothetical protein